MKKIFSLLTTAALAFSLNAVAGGEDNYINKYGRLKLVGKQLSSETGNAIQLKGWSSFGWMSNWGDCHQKGHLQQMKAWGANIYRGAMYVEEGGYNNDKEGFINQTKTFIDQTAELGMYYLCDWHVLTPGNPNDAAYSDASYYFKTISEYVKSKGYIHVLYEICNEPNGCSWNDIKQYADKILPIIQQNDPGACVVVGTPQWDQNINEAANNPIQGYDNLNILYAFHYYSCSHQQFLSRLENTARTIPIFISEWGIANFDGGQGSREVANSCFTSADQLINIADGSAGQKISWCAWSFGEKNEQASSLMSCGSMELSTTGRKVVDLLDGGWICCTRSSQCYENTCQEIPGIVDLGKYNVNTEFDNSDMGFGKVPGSDTYVGGGEGVTYHEENTVSDEVNDRSLCNGAYKWAGEDYAFRQDECVDVSGCYGLANTEGWHNLGYIEPGEWITLTLDITEPGYYSLQALCNPTTKQILGISSVSHRCNLLVDMTNDKELYQIAFVTGLPNHGDENYKYWEWTDPVSNLDDEGDASNYTVLFKEAEPKHTIKIHFLEGVDIEPAGDLGPLKFTKVKAYNGPGYDTKNEDILSYDNSLIYPNPSNGTFSVATAGELTITNLMGEVVYATKVEADTEINTNLKAGNYIARVKTADAVKVAKIIIK
ncbi:MAG: cellulase family glycosylhydrolase [Paludibacteraceae bacterium]|nr:cellulase family glycosylhydrolase [Paludibacteraceae bacterium]